MKRLIALIVLGAFCCVFAGCHTTKMLSRIDTGRVGCEDIWQAILKDESGFKKSYW